MVTKDTWKFKVSAPQPDVYDACNDMKRRSYHLQTLWCVPGGHHSRGEQKGENKTETRCLQLFQWGRSGSHLWFQMKSIYLKSQLAKIPLYNQQKNLANPVQIKAITLLQAGYF